MQPRSRARRWAAGRLIPAALVIGLAVGGSPAPVSDAASVDTNAVAEAIRFRAGFGLETSRAFVESLLRDPALKADRYGTSLTQAEEALMTRRDEIQDALRPALEYGHAHSAEFGGMWLEYPQGATLESALTVHAAFTANTVRHAGAIQSLIPPGADLEVREVAFAEASLDAMHRVIANDKGFFAGLGTKLYSITTLVPDNAVEIAVSKLDPQVERAVLDRFGAALVRVRVGNPVQPDACASRNNCGPPWRGGIHIVRAGPANCTSGFVVRKPSGGSYVYAIWTAGHCGSGTWRQGSTSGTTIGTTSEVHFQDAISTDIQVIPISAGNKDNKIIDDSAACTNCTLRAFLNAQQSQFGDMFGDTVCNDGYVTGKTCGTIRSTNFTFVWEEEGVTLFNFRRASYARNLGDSGGPVWTTAGSKAVGSHTHFENIGGTNFPVYAHVYWATQYTGYSVNLVPAP